MEIIDLIKSGGIILELSSKTKPLVFEEMADVLVNKKIISDKKTFLKSIWKREEQFSTAIGEGIAIPHAKCKSVKIPSIVFAKSKNGLEFNSLDNKLTNLFFMIAVPFGDDDFHLKALAKLSRKLVNTEIKNALLNSSTKIEINKIFKEM